MEKRVTRHSSTHATKASTDTTAPPTVTPVDAPNGSKRGRGRGWGARAGGRQASTGAADRGRGRGRGATRGRKRGVDAAGETSAPEETDHEYEHEHDQADSDHGHDSEGERGHETEKGPEQKEEEPEKDKALAKIQESEREQESDNSQEHRGDVSQDEDSSSSGSESESEEDEATLSKDKDDSNAMDVDSDETPNAATTSTKDTAAVSQAKQDGMEEDRRPMKDNSASGAFEEVSSLPFISPTFPPSFDTKEVEPMPLDCNDQSAPTASSSSASSTTVKSKSATVSSTGATTAVSRGGFFLDENIYNKLSIGGAERIAELYMLKKRRREKGVSPEPVPRLLSDTEAEAPSTKPKRRTSGSVTTLTSAAPTAITAITTTTTTTTTTISKPPVVSTHAPAVAPTTISEDQAAQAPTTASLVAPAQSSTVNLNDLIASASSYKSEIISIADKANKAQQSPIQQQQPQQQQQQQSTIAAIKPADMRYHHPCIGAHQYRSSLTREEHRRYMMYDGVLRRQKTPGAPQLGQEDRALFGLLQERVEAERLRVRQWCDSECRSRVISYFNPLIRDALAPKFRRGRARVKEEYPQYYDFVHSIGLRLPGVPSTTKEPMLSRAQLEEPKTGSAEAKSNKPAAALRRRGLLHRTGKICPVSLAKPILPTDDNGVPYEKTIDVVDSYWNHSASPAPATDRRRGPMPFKRPATSVAKDPIAKDFVKEQNVHIALASSVMVALAKTLPSLANEWEIPVTVVLEEDAAGVMQKRIYVDKPLIPKRMTTLEITQAFYDGALKKLSLVGSSSSDVSVLEPQQDNSAGAGTSASISTQPQPNQAPVVEQRDIEMQDVTDKQEGVTSPKDVEMEEAENKEAEKTNSPSETPAAAAATDKDSKGEDEDVGVLGSQFSGKAADEGSTDNFEYSLWTFGDKRLLIRNRLHGYINNTIPHRQVVIKSILDYVPDIGVAEPGKSTMAGWWMSTWVRDDRLLALGRVDVSRNQFVRYPDQLPPTYQTDNPLGGAFSDLPSISIKDTSALKVQDREIWDWIKPNMRLIHYILGKLQLLGAGQYILTHKRHDVSANVYRAVKTSSGEQASGVKDESQSSSSNSAAAQHKGQYDLHAAHASSPQPLSDAKVESSGGLSGGGGSSGGGADDDLLLRWIGTPDQIPGTFPYEPESDTSFKKGKRGRGGGGAGGGGGGRGNKRNRGRGATKKAGKAE
ncbi:hypothetical protein KI688_007335 [Linnemannia hyalina]|uniref:Little elongation complex subunit 2 C-terminal domain-containing protein n=1 Tax=Linnemannia hyalina TaxID=64524 RepID=A0A9P7XIR0_9FUNG|nr:hypothetical protein KI688_007335 [Linnemannia hyalina]